MIEALITGRSEAEAAGAAARGVVRHGGAVHMIPCSHGDMIEYFVSNSPDTPGNLIDREVVA
ncbi:hypothetical protein SH611_22770 [Geminicoccaceae bacterium 1502E]|nr:hypothetical protein [Geminicoccaceae bacterium 1502E]